jgi:hypothetical protein
LVAKEDVGRVGRQRAWRFKCDCGNEPVLPTGAVTYGNTKSCGCYRKEYAKTAWKNALGHRVSNKLAAGEAAFNALYRNYSRHAKDRGLLFELSKDEFRGLVMLGCYYCEAEPSQVSRPAGRGNGSFIYNGIDRMDNLKGYSVGNCVPCCGRCNRAKTDLSYQGFVAWLVRAGKHAETLVRSQDENNNEAGT